MRVGIIFEGTFPYVTGGVSSWANTMMRSMPDIEFTVIHISAKPEKKIPKYKFSSNIKDYFEFSLFAKYKSKKKPLPCSIAKEIAETIVYPFDEKYMSVKLYEILKKAYNYDFTVIPESDAYWDFLESIYKKFIPYEDFNYFFWNVRSMLLPFMNALTVDLPVCDLYHSVTTGYAGLTALMSCLKYNKPFIITEHGIYHRERQLELLRAKWVKDEYRTGWIRLFNTISALTYYGSSAVTTLFLKNQIIEKELCDDHKKLSIIPNGINYELFSGLGKSKEQKTFNLGLVGRVVEIKDIKTAIKAFKLINEYRKDIYFFIIGPTDEEPEYFRECQNLVQMLDLNDYLSFTGSVDVKQWYPKIDLAVLSSVSEGQPLALLEAMACGIPVVATDVGSCSEIIFGTSGDDDVHGACGEVVNSKDFIELSKAILKFANNPELYKNASQIAKMRVEKRYGLKNMLYSYRKIYESVVL
jgi:glycosyltransferase involved in cell wall biosynthesis